MIHIFHHKVGEKQQQNKSAQDDDGYIHPFQLQGDDKLMGFVIGVHVHDGEQVKQDSQNRASQQDKPYQPVNYRYCIE